MRTSTQPSPGKARHGAITAVVCLALAAVVSAVASLNVALPDIARSTHASLTQLEWVIDAYSLVFAALLLPAGALGDRYGRRVPLADRAGHLRSGLSGGDDGWLRRNGADRFCEAVMGLGAALVMPATLSTITEHLPAQRKGHRAVGIWAGVAGASCRASGVLCIGGSPGVLVVAIGVWAQCRSSPSAAIAGTLRYVPESADQRCSRGSTSAERSIAVVGLVALVYSVIEAPDRRAG